MKYQWWILLLFLSGYSIVNGAALAETVVSSVIPSSGESNSYLESIEKKMNHIREWYNYYEKGLCQAEMKEKHDRKIGSYATDKEHAAGNEKALAAGFDQYCQCVATSMAEFPMAESPEFKESDLKDLFENCISAMLRRINLEMYRMYGS